MLLKKVFLLASFIIFNAQAADVRFNVSGSIKNTPCNVIIGAGQNISMGSFNKNVLDGAGKKTPLTKFDLTLDGYPKVYNNVQVIFEGDSMIGNPQLLAVTPGGAENVGIAFYEADALTLIPINSWSKGVSVISTGPTTLSYHVGYTATGMVSEGVANATASFTIAYD